MPRSLRVLVPGTAYHVIARGNGGRMVFLDDPDRRDFLRRLRTIAGSRGWSCPAYCLMGTHLHMVIETPQADLPHGIRDLLGAYARAFNWRYATPGHLFRDRHRAIPIDDDAQMTATIAYVLRNPVRAGLVGDATRWPWSNCAYLLGERPSEENPEFTSLSALDYFGDSVDHARDELARQLEQAQPPDVVYPRADSIGSRPDIVGLLGSGRTLEGLAAAVAAGHSQSDIARFLGVSPAAISRRLARHRASV